MSEPDTAMEYLDAAHWTLGYVMRKLGEKGAGYGAGPALLDILADLDIVTEDLRNARALLEEGGVR